MSSEEERFKHSRRRKRNVLAKAIVETKGPFAIKVVNPKKGEYKREKIRLDKIYGREEDDETDSGGIL